MAIISAKMALIINYDLGLKCIDIERRYKPKEWYATWKMHGKVHLAVLTYHLSR